MLKMIKSTNVSSDIQMVFMGLDYIFLDSQLAAHIHTKNRMSSYAENQDLIKDKIYSIHCMGDVRWIGIQGDDVMVEIDRDLVDRFFKPLTEIRQEKLNTLLK